MLDLTLYSYQLLCVCLCLQVIVALSEKSRTHIPYRNSMMTSVLRDRCLLTVILVMFLFSELANNHVQWTPSNLATLAIGVNLCVLQ